MPHFHVASDKEIKQGETTDIYFVRTKQILEAEGVEETSVVADVTPGELPENWNWSVLCGVEELAYLFEGVAVDVFSMPEGTVFYSSDHQGIDEPVLRIEGAYGQFCLYETPLLGLICQATGIATRAARMRNIVGGGRLVSFGIRRMHPALSPMIDRAAFIGGFDAVSCLAGADATDTKPVGTMPHSLIIVVGDALKAWTAFDRVIEENVPRVALVDTYSDEKTQSILAAKALKRLNAVRLDTPLSRKGSFAKIVREIRWELDLRGYEHVQIFVSGGLNEDSVKQLVEAGATAFGVGTYISSSPTVNFALDIVEKDGKACAKRGKFGGKKEVWRCPNCFVDVVLSYFTPKPNCSKCGGKTIRLLQPLIKNGRLVAKLPPPERVRNYVLKQLRKLAPQ